MSHLLSDEDAQAYLDLGITPRECVRLVLPTISDREADHLLWEWTPWPMVSGVHDIVEAVACAFDRHGISTLTESDRRGFHSTSAALATPPQPAP